MIIIPRDASHHLHLSCSNSFMTANAENISVWWQQPLRMMKGVTGSVQVTMAFHLGCFIWLWSAWGEGSFSQVILPCHHTPSLTPKDACHEKVHCSACMPSTWEAPTSERSIFFQIVHSASVTAKLITAGSQDNNFATRQEEKTPSFYQNDKTTRV